MDCIVHGVTKRWRWLSNFHFSIVSAVSETSCFFSWNIIFAWKNWQPVVNLIPIFSRHDLENEQSKLTSSQKISEKQKSESWKKLSLQFQAWQFSNLWIFFFFFANENSDDANKSFIMVVKMFQYLEDLCKSVNQHFPND